MTKFITTYEHGQFDVKQIKWKPERDYNRTDLYASLDDAIDFVSEINKLTHNIIRRN